MKYIKILMILMGLMLMTGCNSFSVNVEDLIEPPVLSKEQAEITEALKAALNTNTLKLKYPRYGENRSSIIFENLDDDEDDEVIVFYEEAFDESGTIRINIMDKIDDKWHSVYDVPGGGKEVEFISFANISSRDEKNIVIGWRLSDKNEKYMLNVYSYGDNDLKTLLRIKYDELIIVPSDEQEGMSNIVILNYKSSEPTAKLIKVVSGNKIGAVGLAKINPDIERIAKVSYGKTKLEGHNIYVDIVLSDETMATEVLTYKDKTLINLMLNDKYEYSSAFYETVRYEEIYCEDINGDGELEIPSQTRMPGYEEMSDEEELAEYEDTYVTTYSQLTSGKLWPVETSLINRRDGYKIIYPSKWNTESVVVKKHPNSGECYFTEFNESFDKSQDVLLKIHVYSRDDYKDLFELQQFRLIATKDNFEYYGYIPEKCESELRVTYSELEKMFKLL